MTSATWQLPTQLINAGISVFPANTVTKRPHFPALPYEPDPLTGEMKPTWNPFRTRYATPEEVSKWPDLGADIVSVVYGDLSHLELFDIDLKGVRAHLAYEYQERVWKRNPALYERLLIWRSKSGGLHIPIRYMEGVPGNQVFAYAYNPVPDKPDKVERTPLIETRGEGGYGVFWPMAGCEIIQGEPTQPPTLTMAERQILIDVAGEFVEGLEHWEAAQAYVAKRAGPRKSNSAGNDGPRPGDLFNDSTTLMDVANLLGDTGATVVVHGGAWAEVTRPGKDLREGSSGDIKIIDGMPIFTQFSTAWSGFEPGKGYSPFGVYAEVVHGGDHKAAGRALYAKQHSPIDPNVQRTGNAPPPPLPDNEAEAQAPDDSDEPQPIFPSVRPDETPPTPDRDFIEYCLRHDEAGDARLLDSLYGGRITYDWAEKAWCVWAGHHWAVDRTGLMYLLVSGQLASQYTHLQADLHREIAAMQSDQKATDDPAELDRAAKALERAQALEKMARDRAHALQNAKRIRAVLEIARSYGVTGDGWDAKPDLLAVENGVVDLRTGKLLPGNPADYLRSFAPTPWEGIDAPSLRWDKFLQEIQPEEPVRDALHRLFGYGITGHVFEHVIAVLYGPGGRNGKDKLTGAIGHVLGEDIAMAGHIDILVGRKSSAQGAEPYLHGLRGKRVVWCSETNEQIKLNPGQIKLITGGGAITTRKLHSNQVTFSPTHLLMLLTNYLPEAPADDEAFWGRMIAIEFTQRFVEKPDPAKKNEHKKDPELGLALQAEASGILAWLVCGCLAWRKEGLAMPKEVQTTTQTYRENQDVISQFIEECCVIKSEGKIGASSLYESYARWAGKDAAMSATLFGRRMGIRFKKQKGEFGATYHGLGLLSAL